MFALISFNHFEAKYPVSSSTQMERESEESTANNWIITESSWNAYTKSSQRSRRLRSESETSK